MDSPVTTLTARRGRPRKFLAPSRAITLTLPDHVIEALASIDADLSRAIVRLTQPELAKRPHPPAELARYGQRAVIVVNPTRTLEQWTGVSLVPLPDGRALISFERPRSIAEVELTISDAIADHRLSRADQATFKAIEEILRAARRSKDVTLQQRSIIVLETRRRARTNSSKRCTRRARTQAPAKASGLSFVTGSGGSNVKTWKCLTGVPWERCPRGNGVR